MSYAHRPDHEALDLPGDNHDTDEIPNYPDNIPNYHFQVPNDSL